MDDKYKMHSSYINCFRPVCTANTGRSVLSIKVLRVLSCTNKLSGK